MLEDNGSKQVNLNLIQEKTNNEPQARIRSKSLSKFGIFTVFS